MKEGKIMNDSFTLQDCTFVVMIMSLIAWYYSQSGLLFFLTVSHDKYLIDLSRISLHEITPFLSFNIRPFRDTLTMLGGTEALFCQI